MIDTERLKDYGYSSAFRFPIYGTLESYPDRNLVYGEILNALTSMAELLRNSEVMAIIDDEKKLKTGSLVLSGKGLRQVPVDILEMDWLEKIVLNKTGERSTE